MFVLCVNALRIQFRFTDIENHTLISIIMKNVTFCICVALIIHFFGVEACSVKPPTTPAPKIPPKSRKIKTMPIPVTTRAPKKLLAIQAVQTPTESRLTKYAKYARSGFFVEIEETTDNKINVYQMKKLPPIYSQTMKRSSDSQNDNYTDSNVQQIFGQEPDGGEKKEQPLTEEDILVQKDWKGECLAVHWRHCSSLEHITVMNVYNKTIERSYEAKHMELDCKLEPTLCMSNGWSINRCQLICMSKCNKAMLQGYDSFVSYTGPCNYI